MLTGKSTIHNGVSRNDDDLRAREITLAEALKAQGYSTALFGKWHRGLPPKGSPLGHPMDQGFDEFFGFTDAKHAWEKFPDELHEGREMKPSSRPCRRPLYRQGGRLPQAAPKRTVLPVPALHRRALQHRGTC